MTVWCMCCACSLTKATDAHSEYVILVAFPWQQWLRENTTQGYIIHTLPVLSNSLAYIHTCVQSAISLTPYVSSITTEVLWLYTFHLISCLQQEEYECW